MAQFKLGRIKFVWQGTWVTGTTYTVDDVVAVGGKSYICTVNHVASPTFVADLNSIPTRWNIIADGTTWRGTWNPQTLYNAGDQVKYGAVVYICLTSHTSANNTPSTITITNLDNLTNPGFVTLTYASVNPTPFPIGSTITVASVNTGIGGYNGTYTVTASSTTTVQYANATQTAWTGTGTIYTYGGLESHQSNWTVFAPSFNWLGAWTPNTRYKTNDFVSYGGYVYICTAGHASASTYTLGLETDSQKWQVFNNGIAYLGTWNGPGLPGGAAVRYRANDVVKWGSDLWICTVPHTSVGTSINTSNFSIFVNGFEFQSSWTNSATYVVGDLVTYGGYTYTAILNNVGQNPTTSPTSWQPFTTGFTFSGDWLSSTSYKVGSVVRLGGYTYVAVVDSANQLPSGSSSYWSRLNAGVNWTNGTATYSAISGTNVTGAGSAATFDITRNNTTYSATIINGGTGYSASGTVSTIKILGTSLDGLSPSNDLVLTVTSTGGGGAITGVAVSGRAVTWITGNTYYQGDVVFFASSSYMCIQTHTSGFTTTTPPASASNNRPDTDSAGAYWNALAVGTESAVLTTTGDMLYYGQNGPTRLPVGTEGQIIRATNGYPVWANYGLINNLVYVGPNGVDSPAPNYGLTIDKPWKTVRYACYQVEQGYLNPNARDLLKKNKQFFIKEMNNYLYNNFQTSITSFSAGTYRYQCPSTSMLNIGMPVTFTGTQGGITAGQVYYIQNINDATHFTISTTYKAGSPLVLTGSNTATMNMNFYYDQAKAERDAGIIIEGLIYDLSRGGTYQTVKNGNAFYSTLGNTYITTMTGYQITQFIASHNYLSNYLIPAVLSNTAPAINYQILNGITSSNQAPQVVDATLTSETGALTYCQGLLAVLTAGLTSGTNTGFPSATLPNTTINIKTGTYNEVLPIVVPENTALVGDELRTSVVQPAVGVTNLSGDVTKTTSALNRISALLPSIASNTLITPTPGNNAGQVLFAYPGVTDTSVTTAVTTAASVLNTVLTTGPASAPSFSFTNPTNYNTSFLVSYGDGKAQIVQNYTFIQAEISAYLAFTYSSLWTAFGTYGQSQTTRDTGYILDAIQYDMTYGGNRQSLIAASAYSSLGTDQIRTAWKAATLAALARLKVIVGQIVQTATVTNTSGNSASQVTTGTPGSAGAAVFAQARIQEIYDAINTGTVGSAIASSTTWIAPALATTNYVLNSKRTAIATEAANWIATNYSTSISYSLTNRDAGFVIDALQYDIIYGTNFNSIVAARRYYANNTSARALLNNTNFELTATLAVISVIVNSIKDAVSSVGLSTGNVTNIINNGVASAPAFTFTTPTGYNTSFLAGYGDGKAQLVQNYTFIQAEISAYLAFTYSSLWTAFGATAQTQTTRDTSYILDALQYDMTYGGNRASLIAASAYSSLGTAQIRTTWKAATLDALARLKTVVGQVSQKTTVTPTSGNSQSQITSGSAGSIGSATFAQARIQEIYDAINTGTVGSAIPASTAWLSTSVSSALTAFQAQKTKIQTQATSWVATNYPAGLISSTLTTRDAGLVFDAIIYDTVYGTNFNGIVAGRRYQANDASAQALLANTNGELTATLGAIQLVETATLNVVGETTGSQGSSTAITNADLSATSTYDVFASGLNAIPVLVQPNPIGYGTNLTSPAYATSGNIIGITTTYDYARAQIVQNYSFIEAEISAYVALNYPSVWSATLPYLVSTETPSDVEKILNAIRWDITYGGNRQTLIAGSAYYSNYIIQIVSTQLPATLAALAYLKTILGDIAQGNLITKTTTGSAPNGLSQINSGTGGNANAAAFVQNRVQEIIDWINNGYGATAISPCYSWVDQNLQNSFITIQNRRSEIASDATAWIQKFYQGVSYNTITSTRDAGYIVDAISYDMLYGGNYNGIVAGRSFYRQTTSAQYVISNEIAACLGAINFMKYKIKTIAGGGFVASAQNIISDVNQYIGGGGKRPTIWPPTATSVSNTYAGASILIDANKSFIRAEILAFITATYSSLQYNATTCSRDVNYILDAIIFDLKMGGNWATRNAGLAYYSALYGLEINSSETTATLAAYTYMKALVRAVATDVSSVTGYASFPYSSATRTRADTFSTVGNGGASTQIGSLFDIVINIITNGNLTGVQQLTINTIASGTTFTTSAAHGLQVGDAIIAQTTTNGLVSGTWYHVVSTPLTTTFTLSASYGGVTKTTFTSGTSLTITVEKINLPTVSGASAFSLASYKTLSGIKATLQGLVTTYLSTNYPALQYNSTYCQRDIGYLVDMVGFDMMLGSNYLTMRAGMSYYQAQASKVIGSQKRATVQAFRYLCQQMQNTFDTTTSTYTVIGTLMDSFINVINNGVNNVVEMHGSVTYNNSITTVKGIELLRANTDFLASEAAAWINSNFGGSITNISSSGVALTVAHNLAVGDPVVFTGLSAGNITVGQTYWVFSVVSPVLFTITSTYGGTQAVTLTSVPSPTMTVNYSFNLVSCKRDTTEFIKGLIYDLQYTGNYKSLRAAELYKNAITGSQLSDMFHVRQSCGVRNMTLNGLNGDLTQPNAYGTRRPTAGAYTSLDPGFGPNDSNVWVNTRSTYCQNVSLFGTGCTGLKIDGALHQGGNRSIVANDYTTILSDGIGVWCTGHSALTELVSVFCYYSYSGYMSELGGRIRATNGNSSYGTWGVIAEGTDTQETPLYSNLNNRAAQAYVTNVVTDAVNAVYRVEYQNAGGGYTNATPAISGAGYNVFTSQDEFRDSSQFETRLTDLLNTGTAGGANYGQAINAAQGGTLYQITIAATDVALSPAYVGMRIFITGGTGVGQYGTMLTYNNGTKVALVYKDSFATLVVTATAVTNNLLTVASTATLVAGMAIYLDTTVNGLQSNTLYYINSANFSATQFQVSTTPGGAGSAVTITTTGSVSINLYAAGFDHCVAGTASINPLDLTTNYVIEPRVMYSSPGYSYASATLPATATWGKLSYGANRYIAVATGATNTAYSTDGATWNAGGAATGLTTALGGVVFGGGYGATAYSTVGGLGGSGATFSVTLGSANSTGAPGADQVLSITVTNGGFGYTSPPTIVITPTSGGSGATATATVLGGIVQAVTVNTNGSGYTTAPTATAATNIVSSVTITQYGYGYTAVPTIVIGSPVASYTAWSSGATATNATYYSYSGNYYLSTSVGTFDVTGPTHTSGSATNGTVSLTYVATNAVGTATLTNYGVYTVTLSTGGFGYTSVPTVTIADLSAKFVAVSSTANTGAYLPIWTGAGVAVAPNTAWTATTALPSTTNADIAYGLGIYVTVGGTGSANSSSTGTSWTARTITTLGAGTWSSVAWGHGANAQVGPGTFVAISTGNNATAYSTNGSSWTNGGNLPVSSTWTSIAYGNNRFVAIASNQRYVAYSLNAGITWQQAPIGLPSAANWTQIRYGQGLFFAVASGSATAATSPDGINWTSVSLSTSSNWNSIVFGSIPNLTAAGNSPTWMAISSTSGTISNYIKTGVRTEGRAKVASGNITEIRLWEPGSGYPKGLVSSTTYVAGTQVTVQSSATTVITLTAPASLTQGQVVTFASNIGSFITASTPYYVFATTTNSSTFSVTTTYLGGSALTVGTTSSISVAGVVSSLNVINASPTTNLIANQPIEFQSCTASGLLTNITYYVIGSTITTSSFQVSATSGSTTPFVLVGTTITGGVYTAGPIITIGDVNHTTTATVRARMGDGALGQPSFQNRGTLNTTAQELISGDGYADLYQATNFISVSNLFATPQPGANIVFGNIPGVWYKLVTISNILGIPGNFTAVFQISPSLTVYNAPPNNTLMTATIKYSQTRLTGHDFLYIGTGNQAQTNYPFVVPTNAIQANQTSGTGGGRVFFTSTDQDGNFNVGGLFGVQQATGTATLNANAFNLSGLQSLTLAGLSLGIGSATITQFSTDPYFTANSDNVLPTQRAIKSYITAQIGGGQSTLNVNTLTAGVIYIANNTISTTSGGQINITAKMNFTGGIDGAPVALGFFLQR